VFPPENVAVCGGGIFKGASGTEDTNLLAIFDLQTLQWKSPRDVKILKLT